MPSGTKRKKKAAAPAKKKAKKKSKPSYVPDIISGSEDLEGSLAFEHCVS